MKTVLLLLILSLAGCKATPTPFFAKMGSDLCAERGGPMHFFADFGENAVVCNDGTRYDMDELVEVTP